MAIVITKKPIDYKVLNEAISKSRQGTFALKLAEALGQDLRKDVDFTNKSGTIGFDIKVKTGDAVAFVIEVDKR